MKKPAPILRRAIRSKFGNEGKVVTCERLATPDEIRTTTKPDVVSLWIVSPLLPVVDAHYKNTPYVLDECLRPIRDPGEAATDEMVALLGKPSSLPQPSKERA